MSDPIVEVTYEPSDCCDVTVHFGNSAFHVHAFMLKKESKMLGVAVEGADQECVLTETCKQLGHRCFTLNSPLGTTMVHDYHMKLFFDNMYNPAKMFVEPCYFSPISADGKRTVRGQSVCPLHDSQWVYGTVIGYFGSQILVRKGIGISPTPLPVPVIDVSANTLKQIFRKTQNLAIRYNFKEFLYASTAVIRLCHFFDCPALSQSFEDYIRARWDQADAKDPSDVFSLLLLCDHCHFDSLVQPIAMWLLQNKGTLDVPELFKVLQSLRAETSAAVMDAAFAHK